MESDDKFVLCTCGSEAFSISMFDWDDSTAVEVCVSTWRNFHPIYSIKNRWQHIKQIIRTGRPYADEVLLTPDTAFEAGMELMKLALEGMEINEERKAALAKRLAEIYAMGNQEIF